MATARRATKEEEDYNRRQQRGKELRLSPPLPPLLLLPLPPPHATSRGSGGKNVKFQIVHMTKVSTQIHSSISQYDFYKVSSKTNDHNLTVGCLNY
jgi:hypothetical protein